MNRLWVVVVSVLVAGCGVMPGSPGYISESKSTFDGGTTISVDPGHASGCCSLGANWRSVAPDYVQIVVVLHGDYSAIENLGGLEFNIDGRIVRLDATGHPTQFDSTRSGTMVFRKSSKAFVMRRGDFDAMLSARVLKVRLHTLRGFVDGDLLENAFGGAAIQGFRGLGARLP